MWRQDGCTAPECGTEQTLLVDGQRGRRCVNHAVWPDWYSAELVGDILDFGTPAQAFRYLAACLPAEIDRRFAAVTV